MGVGVGVGVGDGVGVGVGDGVGVGVGVAKSKNTSLEARSTAPSEVTIGGFKVRAISGVDSSKLKIKKTFNN